ncbi:uncharacterized protein LOC129610848 [Condylostylus longicornis]|uniref:uncharacterized protein LOC129610848 n=1 Tax=Condylostylus longicornis TaxID=2530218 RepID=UPI00244D99BB|nr:uncharacterized protein LOC129610848 [Condylostylus longicornis]
MCSIMKGIEAKVVILGSGGVGKTSLITRYAKSTKPNDTSPSPTIGASFFNCKIFLEDVKITLQVWDTAGQERFKAVAPMYYRNANAALLCFDLTQYSTFKDIKIWVQELHRNVQDPMILILVGNKLDLENSRTVSRDEAFLYASSIGANYFETSAQQDQGLNQVFLSVALGLVHLAKEGKSHTLKQFDSSDSITAYMLASPSDMTLNLPSVQVGIPVENNVKANGVGRLERVSWSIDHIAHADVEKSGWCC